MLLYFSWLRNPLHPNITYILSNSSEVSTNGLLLGDTWDDNTAMGSACRVRFRQQFETTIMDINALKMEMREYTCRSNPTDDKH